GLIGEIQIIHTHGDRVQNAPLPLIGGKGVFTAELEAALRDGAIDLAVHSLKDLPTELPAGLAIGAVLERASAADVLISRAGHTLDTLPPGATVGTSSRRRAAQLRSLRPDLRLMDLRGNVDTRLRKALDPDGPYDAIVLAHAGLERLGFDAAITQVLPTDLLMPAPGQGALAVQCRAETAMLDLLAPLDHPATRQAVTAERSFLIGLGGGCAVPVAAYATVEGERLHLRGRILAADGHRQINVALDGPAGDAAALGMQLARRALLQGAAELLAGESAP
ncbi:MAG: hydroxymethylbilane synthase, partial [Anaerolineae bacterium]|nr:hydroxymethylbilane synthase [Anaerolineae bacterium]